MDIISIYYQIVLRIYQFIFQNDIQDKLSYKDRK